MDPQPISVLLVDDNPKFLEITTRYLHLQGGFVILGTANNGLDAIKQARRLRPQVILLDLGMPGMSGLEAIPRLRESSPEAAIIALTMLDTDGYRQAALKAGADAFVAKASMSEFLMPAIHQAKGQCSESRVSNESKNSQSD